MENWNASCGDGLAIYVRDGIPFTVEACTTNNGDTEILWIKINGEHCEPLVACVFCPGDTDLDGDFPFGLLSW